MSRILWFHPRWPFPPRGGGDLRTTGLVAGALSAGHEVLLVVPANRRGPDSAPPADLKIVSLSERRGLANVVAKAWSKSPLRSPRINTHSMDDAESAIAAFEAQLVVVSEVMAWSFACRLLPAGVPWIYDAHNVEHELFDIHVANAHRWRERRTMAIDRARVAQAEQALIHGAAAVMVVSGVDAEGVRKVRPGADVVIVPSSVPVPSVSCDPVTAGPVALFVGSLDFPPNEAAVEAALNDVIPRVRRACPEASLLVVGRRPSRRMRTALESLPWVEFVEDAPDVAPAYASARCVLMPFGPSSGTKLKLYEAMAFGVPIITTPDGVAGVPLSPDSGVVVSKDSAQLALQAIALMRDPARAGRLGAAGRRAFLERHTWERSSYPLLDSIVARNARSS